MKDFFKFLGGSLFSNNNVLKGKKRKFYQSLIVVILSLIIAIIPVFVYTMRVNGSQAITKTDNSSLDVSLTLFSKYLYENEDVGLTTDAEGHFVATGFKEVSFTSGEKHLLTVRVVEPSEDLTAVAQVYRDGIDENGKATETPKSFMLIQDTTIGLYTFGKGATNTLNEDGTIKTNASFTSSYVYAASAFKNQDFASFYKDELNGDQYCIDQWKNALNKMYTPYKTSNVLYSISIYSCINVLIILTMSLIIMILTRLKSSQCEKMSYLQALNCVNYASFSTSIIAMCLGFLISAFAPVAFILCIGIRCVFLGFKASRSPEQ